jgi:hypothetical protein
MSTAYEGPVIIQQGTQTAPAEASIVVRPEDKGGGWEIAVHDDPAAAVKVDASRLVEVTLPSGRTGHFVEWRRAGGARLGVGLGWPPTAGAPAR